MSGLIVVKLYSSMVNGIENPDCDEVRGSPFYDETTTDVISIIMPNPADVIKAILCIQNIHSTQMICIDWNTSNWIDIF